MVARKVFISQHVGDLYGGLCTDHATEARTGVLVQRLGAQMQVQQKRHVRQPAETRHRQKGIRVPSALQMEKLDDIEMFRRVQIVEF